MTETVVKLADLPRIEPFVLHADDRAAIEHETHHYEDPRAASIEALKIVQKRHGWVPDGALPAIGEVLGIPASDVEGVATFYNLIFRSPVGRHVIKICDSVACYLTGYPELSKAFSGVLGIGMGQTTADGRFTLMHAECLGSCGTAPCALVNEKLHENLTPENVSQVIDALP